MTETTFSLDLSAAELAWLAGAFGQTRLLLPEAPLQRLLDDELSAELAVGQASLAQRGLIRHVPGSGWQVEGAAAAVVQLLAGSERTLSLLHLDRDGIRSRAMLYRAAGMHLLLESPPAFHLTFCQDAKTALEALLAPLGPLPARAPAGGPVPLPGAGALFPDAWRKVPALADVQEVLLLTSVESGTGTAPRRGLLLGPGWRGGELDAQGSALVRPLSTAAARKLLQTVMG